MTNVYIYRKIMVDYIENFLNWTRTQNWRGRGLWAGDLSLVYDDSWLQALSEFRCLQQVCCSTEASRWEGQRLIDFYFSSIPQAESYPVSTRLSDHKIIALQIPLSIAAALK